MPRSGTIRTPELVGKPRGASPGHDLFSERTKRARPTKSVLRAGSGDAARVRPRFDQWRSFRRTFILRTSHSRVPRTPPSPSHFVIHVATDHPDSLRAVQSGRRL